MATGLEVAEVFRRHGETYRQVHAEHLGRTERRVMGAIAACRTAALGGHAEFTGKLLPRSWRRCAQR